MPTLRLLTINARRLSLDRAALARYIADHDPDLVCVHGSPSLLRWRSISAGIARRAGLVVVGGGRTGGANLLLSTLGVDVDATRDLRFTGGHGPRPAGATLASLRLRGSAFVAAGARLSGSPTQRAAQAGELQAALAGLALTRLPAIISVEGVDGREAPAWQTLSEGRAAMSGGVFVDNAIAVADARELSAAGTERPVLAELTL